MKSAEVDWDAGVGTYLCGPCSNSAVGRRMVDRWISAWVERERRAFKAGRRASPPTRADARAAWGAAMSAARTAVLGGKELPESATDFGLDEVHAQRLARGFVRGQERAREVRAAGGYRPSPAARDRMRRSAFLGHERLSGDWWYCRGCGELGYRWPGRGGAHIEMHLACAAALAAMGNYPLGRHARPAPPRRRGGRLSSAKLMDSYEMVVRHRVLGESLAALADREWPGTGALDAKTIEDRIRTFLELLPDDDRGGRWLQQRAAFLKNPAQNTSGGRTTATVA